MVVLTVVLAVPAELVLFLYKIELVASAGRSPDLAALRLVDLVLSAVSAAASVVLIAGFLRLARIPSSAATRRLAHAAAASSAGILLGALYIGYLTLTLDVELGRADLLLAALSVSQPLQLVLALTGVAVGGTTLATLLMIRSIAKLVGDLGMVRHGHRSFVVVAAAAGLAIVTFVSGELAALAVVAGVLVVTHVIGGLWALRRCLAESEEIATTTPFE